MAGPTLSPASGQIDLEGLTSNIVYDWNYNWPENNQAGNSITYDLWFPEDTVIENIEVQMGTINTQGNYTLTIINEVTGQTVLSAASFNMNSLVADTVTALTLTATEADLALSALNKLAITLNSDDIAFDGSSIYISVSAKTDVALGAFTLPFTVAQGGTGATNASTARTNLGLGSAALLNTNQVVLPDGSVPQTLVTITSGETNGVQLSNGASDFGWRDILSTPTIRSSGPNDPSFNIYRGNIRQFQFTTGIKETFHEFHIPHDYLLNSDIFLHVHWSQNVVDTGGPGGTPGDVKWYFEVSYSKGHNQAAFIAPITASIVATCSGTQYQHLISELQLSAATPSASQLDSNDLEVDGVILVRLYRDSNDIADTANQNPFLHFCDIHYQSTNIATINKTPNFYS